MAKIYGKPSGYLRQRGLMNYLMMLAVVVAMILIFLWFIENVYRLKSIVSIAWTFFSFFALLKVADWLMKRFKKNSDKFKHGRNGENEVAKILQKLPDKFYIFRNVTINNRGDIDFIVLCPGGIFSIEVKSHKGAVGWNGSDLTRDGKLFPEKNIINQADRESATLHYALKDKFGYDHYVQPVIVFSSKNAILNLGAAKINRVYITRKDELNSLLNSFPSYLDEPSVERIKSYMMNLAGLSEG